MKRVGTSRTARSSHGLAHLHSSIPSTIILCSPIRSAIVRSHPIALTISRTSKPKMDTEDPIHQFFTPQELESPYTLYKTLNLPTPASNDDPKTALSKITSGEIRTAYRKAALKYHPDKHAGKDEWERKRMEREFQRVGFAFAVLSDETRRRR